VAWVKVWEIWTPIKAKTIKNEFLLQDAQTGSGALQPPTQWTPKFLDGRKAAGA